MSRNWPASVPGWIGRRRSCMVRMIPGRLEPAAKFNPQFTHRVRITAATDLDDELRGWLAAAYALAG
jgi:hypothetical protein